MATSTPRANLRTPTTTTMSSLEIAKLTGKNHADVCRDIRRISEQIDGGLSKFAETQIHPQNKQPFTVYHLPRAECDLVVSGYSVKYRWAIIQRWHELEAQAQTAQGRLTPAEYNELLAKQGKVIVDRQAVPTLASRWLLSLTPGGQQRLFPIPEGARMLTDEQLPGMIGEPGEIPLRLLPAIIRAAADRLLRGQAPSEPVAPPAAKLPGRPWKNPTKAEAVMKSMRFKLEEMYDFALITPERVEALYKAQVVGPRQIVKLRRLMA